MIVSQFRNSNETKLGQSFQAFRSERQKRTTSVDCRITLEPPYRVQTRNSIVSLNPLPLKVFYSDGLSVGN